MAIILGAFYLRGGECLQGEVFSWFLLLGWAYKGTCHLRFSGIRPLRGGEVPPFSAKEKNLLFFTLIFR